MKRSLGLIAAGVVDLGVLGILLLGPWRTAETPPSAEEILARALKAEASVHYSGLLRTITLYQGREVASMVRVYHQAPDRERMEYESAELAGLLAGRNERGWWRYDLTLARTILAGPMQAPNEGPRREDLIRRNYHLSYLGRSRVAGRPTYLLSLTPKHPGNPSRRLWVDQATFVILRREDYNPDGSRRTQTAFRQINYRPRFAADLFEAPTAGRSRWITPSTRLEKPLTLEQLSAKVGFPVVKLTYLPPGYQYVSGQVYRCPCGCGMMAAQLQYTDGLNCLTVFEMDAQHAGCSSPGSCVARSKGEPSCLLADYGYARFASVITPDLTFVAVGDLVQEELVRVVEGLRRQVEG